MPRVGAAVLKARYIQGAMSLYILNNAAFEAAGKVYLVPIDVPWPIIIDRIVYQVGSSGVGNVRLGVYREGATADSPEGGALVVESASVAQTTENYIQMVTVADTLLIPGQYFVGIQGSNTSGIAYLSYDPGKTICYYYNRSGGYGAYTDPCPTLTTESRIPFLMLRVKENLPAGYRL